MNYWIVQENQTTAYSASLRPLLSILNPFFPVLSGGNGSPEESPRPPFTIAAAGAGGKSSLLFGLLREAFAGECHALLTTTTHMFLPEPLLKKRLALGKPVEPEIRLGSWIKCQAPEPEPLAQACAGKDLVLIEADGSRRLPLKVPNACEPVIPKQTNCILAVYGLSALGRPLSAVCHRYPLLAARPLSSISLPESLQSPVTPRLMGEMMREFYLKPLTAGYPAARILPVWNQADSCDAFAAAKLAAEVCGWPVQLITHFEKDERISDFANCILQKNPI